MSRPAYMDEHWFLLLSNAAGQQPQVQLAKRLNVSAGLVSQVLNGSGLYGTGQASTARFALKVIRTLGRFECPHRKANGYENVVISADRCRSDSLRPTPAIGAMRDLWLDCQKCPNRPQPAKPVGRPRGASRKTVLAAKSPAPQQLPLIPPDAPAPTPAKEPS